MQFLKTHSDYFTIDESQNITLVQSSSSIASEGGVVSLTPTSDKQSTGTRDKVEEVGSSDKAAEEEEKMVHSELTVNSIKPTKRYFLVSVLPQPVFYLPSPSPTLFSCFLFIIAFHS